MSKLKYRILTFLIPITAIILFFTIKCNLDFFLGLLPDYCPINKWFGIKCPGCGNTRSVIALLNFDFISSIKYNPMPLGILIVLIILYIELIFKAFFKEKKLLPRNKIFWIGISLILIVYYIGRNFIS